MKVGYVEQDLIAPAVERAGMMSPLVLLHSRDMSKGSPVGHSEHFYQLFGVNRKRHKEAVQCCHAYVFCWRGNGMVMSRQPPEEGWNVQPVECTVLGAEAGFWKQRLAYSRKCDS